MTKLNSHLKKGFISILSLTLILSSLNVYAMDLDDSNIIVEEDELDNDIINNDYETNIDDINQFLQYHLLNSYTLSDNINQENEISLMSNDNEENNITTTSLDEENVAIQSNDTTTIDVTGLASGSETSHDCNKYLTNKYNSTQHWKECSLCGKVIGSKSNHSLHTTGTYGCDSSTGYQYNSCNCGYSIRLTKKPHNPTGKWLAYSSSHCSHIMFCSDCGVEVKRERCKNASGQVLGCLTGISGICATCGGYVDGSHHYRVDGATCVGCGKNMITYNSIKIIPLSENKVQIVSNVTLANGVAISGTSYACYGTISLPTFSNLEVINNGNNNYIIKEIITFDKSKFKAGASIFCGTSSNYSYNGVWASGGINTGCIMVPVDNQAPIYSSSSVTYNNKVGSFATKAVLNFQYKETYDSVVYIRVLDSNKSTIISNWGVATQNGTIFSRNIDLTTEVNGSKTIYVEAKDSTNNTSSLTQVTISNLDSKAPTPTSGTTTSTTWSTSKNMTFTANDVGSGNVQIAFNNTKNYMSTTKNNTSYSKTYTFIGDVYGSTKAAVYYKDALGNETTQFVTISNIDNTKPTITKVENSKALGSTSLTVTANDINTTLNKSGSGVSKYIITSTNSTPSEDDSNWQTSNILKVTTPGTYYIFAKDLVGNISNAYKVDVKVNYTLSVNPNGGSWNNSSTTQEFTITNGDAKTIANPSRIGYTFNNWTLNGSNAKFENSIFTMGNANASLVANWNINQYNVTYIDVVNSINGKQLGKTTKKVNYNSNVRGSDIGSSTSDNAYYNGYYYSSDTNASVTTNGATVYRIFKLRTIDKTSNLTWNDNNNKNGFRPSKYTLKLMRNGALFKQVELTSYQTSYTFSNLTKYDSKGNAFKYTFEVDASDRYKITLDSNGNTITENYQNSNFSVTIPKIINLNGLTGKGNYNVKVSGIFYYNDTLTVTPSNSFTLKDKNNINSLQANITQNTTSFTKNNLGSTSGSISLNKTKFAGKFNGTFNFNIKFVMKN